MELTNTVRQRYKYQSEGKTPSELEAVLQSKGVKGFVVNVDANRITLLVDRKDEIENRRIWNDRN